MNTWLIAAIVIGVLAIAGFTVANTITVSADVPAQKTASCGSGSCNGTCTAGNGCGAASCGATTGGTCSCGKR